MLAGWKLTCGRAYFRDWPAREVGKPFNTSFISMKAEESVYGNESCASFILDRARSIKTKNILVYVHGYRNSFSDAVSRARAFAEDIQFSGLVLVWAWPSQGWFYGYEDDEKAVSWSTDHFINFMSQLMNQGKDLNIDFVAHSMGNHILVDMAAKLKRERPGVGRALVFAAPDVANEEFSQKISSHHFQTLYASDADRALQAAKYLHDSQRAGGADDAGVLTLAGLESINAILRGHAYVYEDPRALRDLARLLNTQESASVRGLTERFSISRDKYWVINP
jgi:esterase/lipase superfamily enzyme